MLLSGQRIEVFALLKKISEFFLKNIYHIFLLLIVVFFFLINFYSLRYKVSLDQSLDKYYIIFIILSIVLSLGIFVACIRLKKINDEKIPKIFVFTALVLGIIYLFLSPLFTGSDEHNHYYRIYEITEGVLVTPTDEVVGSELPESLSKTFGAGSGNNTTIKYENINEMLNIKLNRTNTIQYGNLWTDSYSNTALYSPVQYFPHVLGFSLAKIFDLGPYLIGMFGRIFNLIFYVILGYFGLKLIPKAKMFYLLVLLSPNILQCATTLSADAFTNVIFLLLIALLFKICYSKDKLDRRKELLLLILCIIISLCKIVYLPVVFLVLLINSDKFKNGKKEKIIFSVLTILLSVIVGLLWMSYTGGVFEIAYDKTALQKDFIFNNILNYLVVFVQTFANYIAKYIECLFVGTTMYHSQLEMPAFISFFYVILVVLALLKDNIKNKFNIPKRVAIGFVGVIIVGLISTAIYIQCTAQYHSVGNSIIEGIQGRYFIPIIMLVPFVFQFKNIKLSNKILYNSSLVINLVTWFYMINQFIA